MSLADYAGSYIEEDVDPGYISEASMDTLCMAILTENTSPDEMTQLLESEDITTILEGNRNIVKLNKKSQYNRAYKVGVIQCAAEAGDKDYKKLRKLWKVEAKLYKKLERRYSAKAKAKARESMKKVKRSKNPIAKLAGNRAERSGPAKNLGGTKKFVHPGITKKK